MALPLARREGDTITIYGARDALVAFDRDLLTGLMDRQIEDTVRESDGRTTERHAVAVRKLVRGVPPARYDRVLPDG